MLAKDNDKDNNKVNDKYNNKCNDKDNDKYLVGKGVLPNVLPEQFVAAEHL